MIKIEDFTKQELINAIVSWLRSDECFEEFAGNIADDLESGEWLKFHIQKLEDEHGNR